MGNMNINCKQCGCSIPADAKFCPVCGTKRKKRNAKTTIIVWAIIVLLVIIYSKDEKGTNVGTVEAVPDVVENIDNISSEPIKTTPNEQDIADKSLVFELTAGEAGEYGELFTLNKDTEFEETYYIYRIPAGTYTVTNTGKYMDQFNIYGDTVYTTENGVEELSDVIYIKLLDVGESDAFTIEDGQIIEIHEPGSFLLEKTT